MRKARLLKLAAYLEKEVKPRDFDMGTVWTERTCGTAGCMMGHAVNCFPKLIERGQVFDGSSDVVSLKTGTDYYIDVASEIFGISTEEADGLFYPRHQGFLGLPLLNLLSTPKDAARVLRLFVAKHSSKPK